MKTKKVTLKISESDYEFISRMLSYFNNTDGSKVIVIQVPGADYEDIHNLVYKMLEDYDLNKNKEVDYE